MEGGYYKTKKFSDEYLEEMSVLMVCLFLAVVIALSIGWIFGDVKIVNRKSQIVNRSSLSSGQFYPEDADQWKAKECVRDSAVRIPPSSGFDKF